VKTETKVGLFILAAIAVFLYLSINIRAFRFDKYEYNQYRILLRYHPEGGQ
jgi:hypothetical protein